MEFNRMQEDPALTPVFHKIFDQLKRRETVRKQFEALEVTVVDSKDLCSHPDTKQLVSELRQAEVELLRAIVTLSDVVGSALQTAGAPTSPIQLVRSCKPLKLAMNLIESNIDKSDELCAILRKCNNDGTAGPIGHIIYGKRHGRRAITPFGLALDLLQYWELVLRYQTKLACSEFCHGVRKSLASRITTLLQYDSFLRLIPATKSSASPSSKLVEVLAKDITDRLERISIRLDQIDSLRVEFRKSAKTEFATTMKRKRCLYGDELATVLSELVHLSDNVRKLLTASNQDLEHLRFIEELTCYRVAACFVNTRKHGVRGRNKTSAVADLEVVAEAKEEIIHVDLLINYKGDGWQATVLLEDLLQVWEIFLRYYTSIEFSPFRQHIGKMYAAQGALSTYTCELGQAVDDELQRKSAERSRYNI